MELGRRNYLVFLERVRRSRGPPPDGHNALVVNVADLNILIGLYQMRAL